MALCSFENCIKGNESPGKVNYYAFPFSNYSVLKKWVAAVNRKNWFPTKSDYVCQYHFPETCFINNNLKEDAVPVSNAEVHLSQVDKESAEEKVPQNSSIFSHTCRLCGKKDTSNMINIFDEKLQIFEKISACLPIIILANDCLPKGICVTCLKQLDGTYALIQNSLKTESKLKKSLQALKLKRENEPRPPRKLSIKGPMDCDVCGSHFTDMALFDEHVESHKDELLEPDDHSGFFVTCTKCGFLYKDQDEYDNHRELKSRECLKCNMILQSTCIMNIHECPDKHCNLCNLPFQNYGVLAEHMTKTHSVKIDDMGKGIFCEICKVLLTTPNSLKDHPCTVGFTCEDKSLDLQKFAGARLFYCNICGHTFEMARDMVKHQSAHGKDKSNRNNTFDCSLCSESFSRSDELTAHCLKIHPPPSTAWICKCCGKSMTTKVSLNIHERIHSGTKPYICEWCGNGFRSRANLMQHHVVHTGVRNHSCPRCGKKFSRKSFVRTHLRVHTGERPFCCDVCGQRFTQVGDMRRHRNRHHQPSRPNKLIAIAAVCALPDTSTTQHCFL